MKNKKFIITLICVATLVLVSAFLIKILLLNNTEKSAPIQKQYPDLASEPGSNIFQHSELESTQLMLKEIEKEIATLGVKDKDLEGTTLDLQLGDIEKLFP